MNGRTTTPNRAPCAAASSRIARIPSSHESQALERAAKRSLNRAVVVPRANPNLRASAAARVLRNR